MKKLYALLVGINEYNHPTIKNLQGCVNDVQNIKKLLTSGNFNQLEPEVNVLVDADATHKGIIDAFRMNLRDKVKSGDIAFFQYSGHGSRQLSAPEFRQFFSEPFDETIVCYDSRHTGGYDLADKELAVLISETVQKGAEMIVMLDCCHSGSGTRSAEDDKSVLLTRQANDNPNERPLESYIDGFYQKQKIENKFDIPRSKHILMAACSQKELAKESPNKSGLFTETLLQILEKTPKISYAELFSNIRKTIIRCNIDQTPQIEPFDGFNPYISFISGEKLQEQPTLKVFFNPAIQKWELNAGSFQGIPNSAENDASFAIYAGNTEEENFIANVDASSVMPHCSYLAVPKLINKNNEYLAKLISLPDAPLLIKVAGSDNDIELLKSLCPADFNIEFSNQISASKYHIEIGNEEFALFTNYPKLILIQKICGDARNCAIHLIELLSKIKNWERAITINNKKSQIAANHIDFSMFDTNQQLIGSDDRIVNLKFKGEEIKAELKAKNIAAKDLYFNLIYYSSQFGIHSLTNSITVKAQSDYITIWGTDESDYFFLPEEKEFSVDTFRLFVSTEPIDSYVVTQDPIENFGETIRLSSREIGGLKKTNPQKPSDWTVRTIEVYLHK